MDKAAEPLDLISHLDFLDPWQMWEFEEDPAAAERQTIPIGDHLPAFCRRPLILDLRCFT